MLAGETASRPRAEGAIAAPGCSPGARSQQNLILLRAAFGQDEANHGTERYPVDNDGLVKVPLEAAGPLVTTGGFVLAKTYVDVISAGAVKLHHDDAAGCSYAGRQYLRDAQGDVLVPAEATSELLAHGFAPVLEEATAGSNRGSRRSASVR